jgi:hypothetical protein
MIMSTLFRKARKFPFIPGGEQGKKAHVNSSQGCSAKPLLPGSSAGPLAPPSDNLPDDMARYLALAG